MPEKKPDKPARPQPRHEPRVQRWNLNYADTWQEAGEAFEPVGDARCLGECRVGQLPERLFLAWLWLAACRRTGEALPGCVLAQDDLGRPYCPEDRTEDN